MKHKSFMQLHLIIFSNQQFATKFLLQVEIEELLTSPTKKSK